jgi:ADP-ribosyl-[dinitrogen reductase] hydrolase
MATARTSQTHPLRIDVVNVPGAAGIIGLTLCPGKCYPSSYSGRWERDLSADLLAIRDWGCAGSA